MGCTDGTPGGVGPVGRRAGAVTRRGVLKGAGALGAGVVLGRAEAGRLRSAARQSNEVQAAVDVLTTAEALAVTVLGVARQRGAEGRLSLGNELVRFLRAAQCEEEAHYHFFQFAGGVPATTRFSMPRGIFRDRETFLRTVVELETIFVGAHMAAARRFAATGDLRLVEVAYQIGAVEAQHLALARYLLGERPANNRAFAEWLFADVAGAGRALTDAGYVGGPGESFAYPGPVERLCDGVFGLVPETTDDATPGATPERGSPLASPQAPATPRAGTPIAGGTPNPGATPGS